MDADGGAGWELLEALLLGRTSAGELLRTSRLLAGAPGIAGVESP
jgi:hypothetical protein